MHFDLYSLLCYLCGSLSVCELVDGYEIFVLCQDITCVKYFSGKQHQSFQMTYKFQKQPHAQHK